MVRFFGQYTQSQWRRGVWMATRPRSIITVFHVALFLLGAVFVVAIVHSIVQGEQVGFREGRRLLFALIVIYLSVRPYVHIWRSAQKGWQQVSILPISGTVDAQGILLFDEVRRKWNDFIRLYVGKDLAVLEEPAGRLLVLPKSFFASEEDWESFLQTAKMSISEPK